LGGLVHGSVLVWYEKPVPGMPDVFLVPFFEMFIVAPRPPGLNELKPFLLRLIVIPGRILMRRLRDYQIFTPIFGQFLGSKKFWQLFVKDIKMFDTHRVDSALHADARSSRRTNT